MLKLVFLMQLLIASTSLLFSQSNSVCHIVNKEILVKPQEYKTLESLKRSTNFEPVAFNVYFWGFRKNNNTGNKNFTLENIENGLQFLNNLYNQCDISFVYAGHEILLSSKYYILESPVEFEIMIKEMRSNGTMKADAFNIYVSNEYSRFGGAVEAYSNTVMGIPSVQLTKSGVLQHEMGHCLSLLHTNNDFSTSDNCESVVRDPNNLYFNADVAGDYVIDTAASYRFQSSDIDPTTCTIISNKTDCYDVPYKIPPSLLKNYLTINTSGCEKDQLTPGQFERIKIAIQLDINRVFEAAKVE